jgi:capsular exopolysaccharide synthesis family protein
MMKHFKRSRHLSREVWSGVGDYTEDSLTLAESIKILRRQWFLVALIASIVVAASVCYLAIAQPRYTASALLVLDPAPIQPLQPQPVTRDQVLNPSEVESQVQVLRSEKPATSVVNYLNLTEDPEFQGSSGVVAAIFNALREIIPRKAVEVTAEDNLHRAVDLLHSNLDVHQIGKSDLIEISYISQSPSRAVEIANAVANAYILDQQNSALISTQRAYVWLQNRVAELQQEAIKAERAAQDFRVKSQNDRQSQTDLKTLEDSAEGYRKLYASYLDRLRETRQQLSFPNAQARVVASASRAKKTYPSPFFVLSFAGVLGLALGGVAALAREVSDKTFRTSSQVEKELGIRCFGVLPAIPHVKLANVSNSVGDRLIPATSGVLRQVLCAPYSRFTETIRFIKVALDRDKIVDGGAVIGIVSAVSNEGKSTVSANIAEMLAESKRRTLLIDGNLREPTLTRQLSPGAKAGLLEVASGITSIEAVVWRDTISGLAFLPGNVGHAPGTLQEVPPSVMADLIRDVRSHFDYVVIDLPPVSPVADALSVSHLIDSFILVIEWGKTSSEIIIDTLRGADELGNKIVGAVLNRASRRALRKLDVYTAAYYDRHSGSAMRRSNETCVSHKHASKAQGAKRLVG